MQELSPEQQRFVTDLTSHQSAIRNLCRILMPGNQNDLEDVVQEINRVILEKANSFEAGTDFKAWAFTITRFQVLAYQKNVSRNRLKFQPELIDLLVEDAADSPFVVSKQQILVDCLSKLAESDRDLLRTRYSQHGSLTSYAQRIDRTIHWLKRRLAKLRDQLKECTENKLANMESDNA